MKHHGQSTSARVPVSGFTYFFIAVDIDLSAREPIATTQSRAQFFG
jgi:hypothetical protein